MIEEAFYSHLANDAGIAAVVSDRIHARNIPLQGTTPAITWRPDGDRRIQTLSGQAPYKMRYFVVDCWSKSMSTVTQLADAVESALIDYRGQLGSTSPAVIADHIRLERRLPTMFERETELFRVPLQFLIGYEDN